MTRRLLLWFLLLGCSSTQIGNEVDAGLDASPVDSAVEEDVVLDAPDAQDIADTPAVPDARDVPSVPDRPVTRNEAGCAIDPPSGPPPEVGRSCGEGRAPSRHCNEVSYCGGTYTVGSLDAHFVTVLTGRNANHPSEEIYSTFRMRSCDLHPGRVEGGYVDAYEVTVARYRAWVNAGMPTPFRPRMNISFFWGGFWNSDLNNEVPRAGPFTGEMIGGEPVSASHCTWTDQPGANEDRPITCIGMAHAVAFCEWEGKHLITSTAWEFLARNRGTTSTPAGEAANNSNRCDLGNVGRTNGVCTRAILPEPVGSSPRDVTVDPPGVYDLYGMMGNACTMAGGGAAGGWRGWLFERKSRGRGGGGEVPHRRRDGVGRRGEGPPRARQGHRRGHQRQHRHRPGLRRGLARVRVRAHHARDHEHRAPQGARGLRRQARAHPRGAGHEGRHREGRGARRAAPRALRAHAAV